MGALTTSDPAAPPPTAGDQLQALSIIDDITGLLHGKGGIDKLRLALDAVKRIAGDVAEIAAFVPGGQGISLIAGGVESGAGALENSLGSTS